MSSTEQIDMAPFSAWLPARPNQDFDLTVKIVGRSALGLIDELATIAQALTLHGCQVMVQTGRLNGGSGHLVLRLRIASRQFYSMGHGCDVVVYLDQGPLKFGQFGLQPGSVLVWEPYEQLLLHPPLPDGVIAYPVPLRELNSQSSQDPWGKGFVAMGVLAHLLGFSEEARRVCLKSLPASRLFDSGYQFASRSLVKHDIYSLPLDARGDARIVLSLENAVKLGFAASHCKAGTDCAGELKRSPTQWIARHLALADKIISVLHSEQFPGVQAYRGPQGNVFALFRGEDASILSSMNGGSAPRILVAADAIDALRLLVVGHRWIETNRAGVVGVVVEEALTARLESVGVGALAAAMSGKQSDTADGFDGAEEDGTATTRAEGEGEDGAEVGFIAWGMTQGMVRDALTLCRNFGMRVAALYPKQMVPLPVAQLESFAGAVKRVKVVIIPRVLKKVIERLNVKRELVMNVNVPAGLLICGALVMLAFFITQPIIPLGFLLTRDSLAIALAIVLISFFTMIARQKAVSQLVGFLVMENGLFLGATAATYGMPLIVELGVFFDVLIAALIAGIYTNRLQDAFDSVDTSHLTVLKE